MMLGMHLGCTLTCDLVSTQVPNIAEWLMLRMYLGCTLTCDLLRPQAPGIAEWPTPSTLKTAFPPRLPRPPGPVPEGCGRPWCPATSALTDSPGRPRRHCWCSSALRDAALNDGAQSPRCTRCPAARTCNSDRPPAVWQTRLPSATGARRRRETGWRRRTRRWPVSGTLLRTSLQTRLGKLGWGTPPAGRGEARRSGGGFRTRRTDTECWPASSAPSPPPRARGCQGRTPPLRTACPPPAPSRQTRPPSPTACRDDWCTCWPGPPCRLGTCSRRWAGSTGRRCSAAGCWRRAPGSAEVSRRGVPRERRGRSLVWRSSSARWFHLGSPRQRRKGQGRCRHRPPWSRGGKRSL